MPSVEDHLVLSLSPCNVDAFLKLFLRVKLCFGPSIQCYTELKESVEIIYTFSTA